MNPELDRIINRAKIGLMTKKNSSFIATILFSLKFAWNENIGSAGTDGVHLYVSPSWFTQMSESARIGLLAQEAWHVAFGHILRLKNRDHKIFNIACDHVINLMLLAAGYELPEGGYHDKRFTDMSAEEVYDILIQEKEEAPNSFQPDILPPGSGSGEDGKDSSGSGMSPQELENHLTTLLVRAATQSKMNGDAPGTIPGEIQIFLDQLLDPKLPWNRILQDFMTEMVKDDYTYRRPNRRYMPDFYLPTQYSEGMGEVVVAVDTSGSVTDSQFQAFISEIHDIQSNLKPSKLTVIDFDTRIRNIHELKPGDTVASIQFTGRGGTNIRDVQNWICEHKPQVALIFTDGEFGTYSRDPQTQVIWVIHSNCSNKFTYPFGKVIDYPM